MVGSSAGIGGTSMLWWSVDSGDPAQSPGIAVLIISPPCLDPT
jgi:hypothetical protein